MSAKDRKSFEKILAFHAAPTLMGVKCGSLPAISAQEYDMAEVSKLFCGEHFGKRIGARFISRSPKRMLIYVYDRSLLEEKLSDKEVRGFLTEYGYDVSWDSGRCLDRLCERLCEKDFPHEVGIFLDYPPEDVRGFIANCGKKCKYCGVWKVYGDVERAKALFECYRNCRQHLCRELEKGKPLCSCVGNTTNAA